MKRGVDQIALPLDWPQTDGDARFILSDANREAFEQFRKWSLWPVKATILTGPRRSGRTLLARSFVERVGGRLFDEAEQRDEEELFHAWNQAQDTGRPLVMIADEVPPTWTPRLPDLKTRLAVTPVIRIEHPDDLLFAGLIQLFFADRGLHIPPDALRFMFEGPMAAGKKAALRQLASAFDPCHYAVHCTRRDRREASEGHWLARFWRQLPPAGDTAIFFRSWYRRVLDDRISGMIDDKAARRAFDEINEFEAQQRDYGTLIVKLYFDVSAAVQEKRLNARAADPWWRVTRRDEIVRVDDLAYGKALDDLRANSDTRWSPCRLSISRWR